MWPVCQRMVDQTLHNVTAIFRIALAAVKFAFETAVPMYPPSNLFDHLVGAGEDRRRHGEAEFLRGLQVDDQFEPRRLLNRQVSRLGTLEDLPGVDAKLAKGGREAWRITDQPAGRAEVARPIDRRNGMARCQCHELLAPANQKRLGADN